jgi:hypothetical protein
MLCRLLGPLTRIVHGAGTFHICGRHSIPHLDIPGGALVRRSGLSMCRRSQMSAKDRRPRCLRPRPRLPAELSRPRPWVRWWPRTQRLANMTAYACVRAFAGVCQVEGGPEPEPVVRCIARKGVKRIGLANGSPTICTHALRHSCAVPQSVSE